MAAIKVYSVGGLDKKSNDLTRATEKASEMINMEYNAQSTIKKRNGYVEQLVDGSATLPSAILDSIYYSYGDEIIVFYESAGFIYAKSFARSGAGFISRVISLPFIKSSTQFPVSYCENQGSLYFTFNDKSSPVMKYDGRFCITSGLLIPFNTYLNRRIVKTGTGGIFGLSAGAPSTSGYYIRVFYKFTDHNGNVTYGPYVQSDEAWADGTSVTFNTFPVVNGYDKYLLVTTVSTLLDSSNRTVPTLSGDHNYSAGDIVNVIASSSYISITSPPNRYSVKLVVESVTTTSVTFTAASLSGVSITISGNVLLDRSCEVVIAMSKSQDTGYYITNPILYGAIDSQYLIVNNKQSTNTVYADASGLSTNKLIPMEDIYDSTTLKTAPPICGKIASFGDQIIYGDIASVYNQDNHLVSYDNRNLIIYSDVSTGDNCENISELNRQKVGDTYDGSITAMKRCNDSLVVFKTNGIYSMDGYLIQGQYSLRKINTNFAGCTSERSIISADEGLYFQSHNGIYFTNAINAQKISFELDPLFLSGSYTDTVAARLKKKQKSIFYVPSIAVGSSKIVVIDYYYNQVYMWNVANNPSSGLIEDNSGDVYFSDGTKLYKFNDGYTDNGTAISSQYSTAWHHAGEPALNKKWLSIRTWGLTSDTFTATITTEGDWQAGTYLTTNTSIYGATTQTDFKMLDMQTKKALRVNFTNAVNNENMVITGYELTYELFNAIDKN